MHPVTIVGMALLLCGAGPSPPANSRAAASVKPALAAASVTVLADQPWLLYGDGLDASDLKVYVATGRDDGDEGNQASKTEKWNAAASLQMVLDGKLPPPPAQPPSGAPNVRPYAADANVAAVRAFSTDRNRTARIVWATSTAGVSNPLVINAPEVWTVTPARLPAGQRGRVFGPNLGATICLVSDDGKITVCPWFTQFGQENRYSAVYERTFEAPDDLPAGKYRLYVNAGRSDYGWSEPQHIEIVAPPKGLPKVFPASAVGDGQTPAAAAIQKAIAAAAPSGGVVLLKPGVYALEATVNVAPGVTLRGAGVGATTLIPPRQGQIKPQFQNYRALVSLEARTTLEYLTIDATDADDHLALFLSGANDATVRHCRIQNLRPTALPKGQWKPEDCVGLGTHPTRNLTVWDNEFRGTVPFNYWGGVLTRAYFGHNRFEGEPITGAGVFLRGMRESVFEHNTVTNCGRGLVVQGEAFHNYFGYNQIEGIRTITNGSELFLYEMGSAVWHGPPVKVEADGFQASGKPFGKDGFTDTAGIGAMTIYAVVDGGRGMGQCIRVKSFEDRAVRLTRPWTLPPDENSQIALVDGCLENLHVANRFRDGLTYSGPYGSAVRNIWCGDQFNNVANGLVLWAIDGPRQMSLNLIHDLRLTNGPGVLLICDRNGDRKSPMTKMFGNEIRACQIYDRGLLPGNEYGIGERPWRYPINAKASGDPARPAGNAIYPTAGQEAGIHLGQIEGWPGMASDEDAKFDALPPAVCWNMVFDSFVGRSPVGIRIGRGINQTVIVSPMLEFCSRPISDSGEQTRIIDPTIRPTDARSGATERKR